MARIDTLINFLTDVAAAIKAKKGDSTLIPAADFDTEIANLPSGDDSMLISLIERTATSFEIPEGTTSMGVCAFYGYTGLTSITIPDGVTSIGDSMFRECTNLTEIDFSTHNAVPTLADTSAFDYTSASLVIKVPSALLDEWKAATNWATYADKIVGV